MLKTAFVFPGQGSQSVGMLADFLPQHPVVTEVFAEASEAVGYDLWQLAQNGPVSQLNQTEFTQVLMLTADTAVFRLLQKNGVPMPEIMAGHSLGEYAALVASQSLTLAQAAPLVAQRAKAMQSSVPLGKGAMAAIIGLQDEQVIALCEQATENDEHVSPANFNAIGQVVVAGHTPAVERVLTLANSAGALMAKIIPVSVPCHCQLLTDAAELYAQDLNAATFRKPIVDVVSNVDLSIYQTPEQIKQLLKQQLFSPVRWVETIQLFKTKGIELIVECGPGKVLGGLAKRIDRSIATVSVYDSISLDQIMDELQLARSQ